MATNNDLDNESSNWFTVNDGLTVTETELDAGHAQRELEK